MNALSRQLKALADPQRLRILALLSHAGECAVSEIQLVLDISASAASRSLRHLEESGWLHRRRDSRWIYYKVQASPPGLEDLAPSLFMRLRQEQTTLADYQRLLHLRHSNQQPAETVPANRPPERNGQETVRRTPTLPHSTQQNNPKRAAATQAPQSAETRGQSSRETPMKSKPKPKPTESAPQQSSQRPKKRILFDFGHK